MEIDIFSSLMETFPYSAPQPESKATFLEIAGYPHLENVISNILSFFFDSQEDHELRTLFLQSLLETAGLEVLPQDLQLLSVEREVTTKNKARLDLVIETQTLLIGIENKIFAEVNNDLKGYEKHLHQNAGEHKPICLLLQLSPLSTPKSLGGFIPITYAAFFESIRKNMGQVIGKADRRYLPFLLDFMETVENLQEEAPMANEEFRIWMSENQEPLARLIMQVTDLKKQMKNSIKRLQPMIDIEKHKRSGISIKSWIYEPEDQSAKVCLAIDFVLEDGMKIYMDVFLHPTYWIIGIAGRETPKLEAYKTFLKEIVPVTRKRVLKEDDYIYEEKLDYDVDKEILVKKVQDLVDQIVAHASKKKKSAK